MNDEIKEILDKLLKYFKESNINDFGYEKDKLISYEEAQIILDYITNLQKENERLKKENRHIFANVNDDVLLRSNAMNYAELQECKKRIDKAIEFIKENAGYDEEISSCCDDLLYSDCDKLIELLGGDE